MLLETLKHLQQFGQRVVVIDDGSTYDHSEHSDICEYLRLRHEGKEGWYKHWQRAFDIAKESGEEFFVFMQDDLQNFDYFGAKSMCHSFARLSCFNIINCGRKNHWGNRYYVVDDRTIHCDFNDCMFFCSRAVLKALDFCIDKSRKKLGSSGVGYELTMRMREEGIKMYMPVKSFAYHGDHESKMHPIERKKNPIISL
jgi:hypothetical protein